jgi:hypothetical protein
MEPAKEDQFVAIAKLALSFPHAALQHVGSGCSVVTYGFVESIFRTVAGEANVSGSIVNAVT